MRDPLGYYYKPDRCSLEDDIVRIWQYCINTGMLPKDDSTSPGEDIVSYIKYLQETPARLEALITFISGQLL